MKRKYVFLFFLFLANNLFAEFRYLGRSPEGLLMGDAYTAIADDENTLFYNPAALARHNGVSLYPINPSFQFPNALDLDISLDGVSAKIDQRYENFPSAPADVARRVLGIPLFLQLGGSPTVKMQHFGLTLFALSKTTMIVENAIHPTLGLSYRLDRGVIAGYGFKLGGKSDKNGKGNFHSVGFGLKILNRQGLEGNFDLFGTELLTILNNSDDYKEIRKNLGFSKGSGFGIDLGYEANFKIGGGQFTFGTSLLDVGDTKFEKSEGTVDVPNQDMSMSIGTAYGHDSPLFSYRLAVDYHNALDPFSTVGSKIHVGARFEVPFVDVYTGWNGGYTSFGVGFDVFFMKFLVGWYGIEVGHTFKEKEAKRFVFSLNLATIEINDI